MINRSPESGNVLFYILIAVVVFAALSMAMSRMGRGGADASQEVNNLQATEILQYARGLRTAVQTMQIDGVTDAQVSLENDIVAGYTNANCTTDNCQLFLPDGGGMSYAKPLAQWFDQTQAGNANFGDWVFSGNNAVNNVASDGSAASNVELLAILPWLRKDLCVQLNTMLGVNNPGGNPPATGGNVDLSDKFTGTYNFSDVISGPGVDGQRTGCFQGGGTPGAGTYHFYQVLFPR